MSRHIVTLGAAFLAGTAATAGLVRLVQWAPIPGYTKRILGIVVPLPSILICLGLLYAGPEPAPGGDAWGARLGLRDGLPLFLYGCLTMLAWACLEAIWRRAHPPDEQPQDPEP